MDDTGNRDAHEAHLGPSARRRAEPTPQDRDEVTLQTEWRTGPRTRAWDELWARLLDGLGAEDAVDGDPDNEDTSPGAPPSADEPDA